MKPDNRLLEAAIRRREIEENSKRISLQRCRRMAMCPMCREEFWVRRPDQQTCSRQCFNRWNKMAEERRKRDAESETGAA